MTATINTQNKPVIPEQVKPVLKAVTHPSKNTNTEHNTLHPIATTKVEKEGDVSKVNKTEETAEEKNASEHSLDAAVQQLNSYVQSINRNLEFNIDTDSGKTVVKVIDAETDELIRQIPNKEALHIAKQLEIQINGGSEYQGLLLAKIKA